MPIGERHDYVIVGGGTSGLTLGYLLEKYGKDVVVLEAGEDKDDDPNIKNIQGFYGLEDYFHNEYFWLENGKPNPRIPNDLNHYSGGRLWGGSSSINESVYWRGTQFIQNQWGRLFADEKFCNDVFCKLETFHGISQNPGMRGDHGPFHVLQGNVHPIGRKIIDAFHAVLKKDYSLDIPIVDDIQTYDGPALGLRSQNFLNPQDKTRMSASVALIKNRKSKLRIKSQATTTKVLFDGKKAIGVQYIHHGKTKTVYANEKVILCAGPRSPSILMHSGIGEGEHLRSLKIPVVYDNDQVGKNLTNHLLLLTKIGLPEEDNKDISEEVHFKGMTNFSAIPDVDRGDLSDIDLEIASISTTPGQAHIACILVNPDSRGYVSICSNDPLHPLVIDTNYLAEPEDSAKLIRGLEVIEKVMHHLSQEHEGYYLLSDLANKPDYVKCNTTHTHHWTGTCQIGKVIDEHLNVIGVEKLMVADTSSIPEITRGHTYAPALLIGATAFVEITGIKDWDF